MFVGRKKELDFLVEKMNNRRFEFGIVYGRRRIGKTSLLLEGLKKEKGIYFVASEMHYSFNIETLSKTVGSYFNEPVTFDSLNDIFDYLVAKSKKERIVIVIDEFTYLFEKEPGIQSVIQNIIDSITNENICLILSGSQVGMIEDVISYKKPLYGRATFKIKLKSMDYFESAMFYPNYSNEDKIVVYSIFGGIPYYLSLVDENKSIEQNIINLIIEPTGFLYDEVDSIIKQELRSISTYKMILDVIASGTTRLNEISSKSKINNTGNTHKHIATLIDLDLLKREIPFNDSENSKKVIYKIKDNLLNFSYKFLSKNQSSLKILGAELFYKKFIKDNLKNYISFKFEDVCKQFLIRSNSKATDLFLNVGTYWGNNPDLKKEVELDILTSNEMGITVFECKWTNKQFTNSELNILKKDSSHLKPIKYGAFSLNGFTDEVLKALDYSFTLDDLF